MHTLRPKRGLVTYSGNRAQVSVAHKNPNRYQSNS